MILKTLKDLPRDCGHVDNCAVAENVLKQEGIKWYKDIEASEPYLDLKGPEAVQMWIKVFFNISEEDLK